MEGVGAGTALTQLARRVEALEASARAQGDLEAELTAALEARARESDGLVEARLAAMASETSRRLAEVEERLSALDRALAAAADDALAAAAACAEAAGCRRGPPSPARVAPRQAARSEPPRPASCDLAEQLAAARSGVAGLAPTAAGGTAEAGASTDGLAAARSLDAEQRLLFDTGLAEMRRRLEAIEAKAGIAAAAGAGDGQAAMGAAAEALAEQVGALGQRQQRQQAMLVELLAAADAQDWREPLRRLESELKAHLAAQADDCAAAIRALARVAKGPRGHDRPDAGPAVARLGALAAGCAAAAR